MTNNSVKYEVLVKQYLPAFLGISGCLKKHGGKFRIIVLAIFVPFLGPKTSTTECQSLVQKRAVILPHEGF